MFNNETTEMKNIKEQPKMLAITYERHKGVTTT